MKKYDFLFIDADETILDFNGAEKVAFDRILEVAGIEATAELLATYTKLNKQFWAEIESGSLSLRAMVEGYRFKNFFEKIELDFDYRIANEIFLAEISKSTLVVDHAEEVLEKLAESYKLYCITNGFIRTAVGRMEATGFNKYFEELFISEAIGFQKPNKGFFSYALDKAGVKDKSRVLVIGDSLRGDMKGGIASGLATCWYNPLGEPNDENVPIDYEIRDLREVFDVLDDMENVG